MREAMQRLFGLIGRGRVTRANSAPDMQQVQLMLTADELKDGMEHAEPFGFTACPEPGAEALALFLGGDRSNGVVISVSDRRYRVRGLQPGESAAYNSAGHTIVLYQDRIEITAPRIVLKAAEEVVADTPLLRATGRIEAAADIVDNTAGGGSSLAAVRDAHNDHTHVEHNGTANGPTDPPNLQV
ncbi:phage baseplate assembly protein V [Pseudogulbenkiania ferrooxidans 2002]|uniref:Phage baseplate assembly protein V n=2 Tax=Pseudogulbenkiania ferrooxidans TaxID=549169 RepID=B9YYV5_9NEIS|nr:phage baseplate assembly protein V [Pseudogulbenkiania ferrooxidans 2002]